MAINQNHLFEDLEGVKCAIVEKNVSAGRMNFLKELLTYNNYKVMVVNSPPPKAAAAAAAADPAAPVEAVPEANQTFTVGVTDVRFNATNAIFGRLLRTPGGQIVTLAYWKQAEKIADDTKPYFE